jgi:hypothetical protein
MGKFNGLSMGGIIGGIIMLVIVFYALAATVPTLNTALYNLSNLSGLPFATLFKKNGIIVLALLGAVILGIVAYFGLSGSKR